MSKVIQLGITVTKVASQLECSEEHVRRLVRAGLLQANKVGRRVYVEPQSLTRYVGRADRQQQLLACEWLALLPAGAAVERVARLLRRTFALAPDDLREVLRAWGAGAEDVDSAVEKLGI